MSAGGAHQNIGRRRFLAGLAALPVAMAVRELLPARDIWAATGVPEGLPGMMSVEEMLQQYPPSLTVAKLQRAIRKLRAMGVPDEVVALSRDHLHIGWYRVGLDFADEGADVTVVTTTAGTR